MKKIYIALTLLSFAFFANATERVWVIGNGIELKSDTAWASLPLVYTTKKTTALDNTSWTATKVTGDLTLNPTGLEISKNNKVWGKSKPAATGSYFSGYTFGQTYQIDGLTPGVIEPAIPNRSYFAFNVAGNATITIYCNPKDAVSKTLNIVNESGDIVGTFVTNAVSSTNAASTETVTSIYTGPATKLTVYPTYALNFNINCLYIYAISVIDTPPTTNNYSAQAETKLMKVGEVLQNEEAEDVVVYNLSGVKVLSSHETEIQISALPKGIYVANTAKGSMKFIK